MKANVAHIYRMLYVAIGYTWMCIDYINTKNLLLVDDAMPGINLVIDECHLTKKIHQKSSNSKFLFITIKLDRYDLCWYGNYPNLYQHQW